MPFEEAYWSGWGLLSPGEGVSRAGGGVVVGLVQ